ncbi:unnamed protein product [Amoebophrya sp. A25]|nr:unnamed protein product [Amoebophrya sp. A25]|eukprot:GSA25T00010623001.1
MHTADLYASKENNASGQRLRISERVHNSNEEQLELVQSASDQVRHSLTGWSAERIRRRELRARTRREQDLMDQEEEEAEGLDLADNQGKLASSTSSNGRALNANQKSKNPYQMNHAISSTSTTSTGDKDTKNMMRHPHSTSGGRGLDARPPVEVAKSNIWCCCIRGRHRRYFPHAEELAEQQLAIPSVQRRHSYRIRGSLIERLDSVLETPEGDLRALHSSTRTGENIKNEDHKKTATASIIADHSSPGKGIVDEATTSTRGRISRPPPPDEDEFWFVRVVLALSQATHPDYPLTIYNMSCEIGKDARNGIAHAITVLLQDLNKVKKVPIQVFAARDSLAPRLPNELPVPVLEFETGSSFVSESAAHRWKFQQNTSAPTSGTAGAYGTVRGGPRRGGAADTQLLGTTPTPEQVNPYRFVVRHAYCRNPKKVKALPYGRVSNYASIDGDEIVKNFDYTMVRYLINDRNEMDYHYCRH